MLPGQDEAGLGEPHKGEVKVVAMDTSCPAAQLTVAPVSKVNRLRKP